MFILECPRVNLNRVDCDSNSALHLAVTFGHLKITYILMMHGADVTLRNNVGFTAEQIAKSEEHDSILHLFVIQLAIQQLLLILPQHQTDSQTTPIEIKTADCDPASPDQLHRVLLADSISCSHQVF